MAAREAAIAEKVSRGMSREDAEAEYYAEERARASRDPSMTGGMQGGDAWDGTQGGASSGAETALGDATGIDTGSDDIRRRRAEAEAQSLRDRQMQIWTDLGESIPTEESQQWHSRTEDPMGAATVEGAAADPGSIEAQRRAMAQLGETYGGYQDIYSHGGMTSADRARQQQSETEARRFERGQIEAQMQQAGARGMLGSGGELLGRFAAQQGGANRANERGLGIEQLAEQRAMAALGGMGETSGRQGGLASGMRGSSFEEDYRRRQARDERDEFNAGIRQRNIGSMNEDQRHNSGLGQTAFGNRTTVAAGKTDQYSRDADAQARRTREEEERRAGQTAAYQRLASSIIGGLASGGSSLAATAAAKAAEEED